MKEKQFPRISVLIITYNQEKLIGRALDSILTQREWGLKDIIVCDDCSTDNNWRVISEYAAHFPEIVRPYRNQHNLGIYGNLQNGLTYLVDTDVVYLCSGDDALCDGLFRKAIQFIHDKKLDVEKDVFTVYCDWKAVSPSGKERIYYNNLIEKGYNPVSLKLRQLICNRSTAVSINVYKKFRPVPVDRGVSVAEGLFDIQLQIHSEKNFYFPFVGSIYYMGIGVSTKMNDQESLLDVIECCEEYLKMDVFSNSDRKYIQYLITRFSFYIHKSFLKFLKVWCFYFVSLKYRIDWKFIVTDMICMLKNDRKR